MFDYCPKGRFFPKARRAKSGLPVPSMVRGNRHIPTARSMATVWPVIPTDVPAEKEWRGHTGWTGELRELCGGPLRFAGGLWEWMRISFPLLSCCLFVYIHLLLFSFTVRAVSFLLYPLLWDWASYWLFWTHSLRLTYTQLVPWTSDNTTDWDEITPWHHRSLLIDAYISLVFRIWLLCDWHSPSMIHKLRQLMRLQPPAHPVCSHDYFWLQDTPENRCEILGFALVDRIPLETLRQIVWERWIMWEYKFISVLAWRWGRQCWIPLPVLLYNDTGGFHSKSCSGKNRKRLKFPTLGTAKPSYKYFSASDIDSLGGEEQQFDTFKLENHVYEAHVNLNDQTIYEFISELASNQLPPSRPRWRLILVTPTSPPQLHTKTSGMGPRKGYSCLVLQIHHGIGDGNAIAYGLLCRLFDSSTQHGFSTGGEGLSDVATFSGKVRVFREQMLTICYYGWNILKSTMFGTRILLFWLLWCAKPPATFQPYRLIGASLVKRPIPVGRKSLSPPVLICPRQMQWVRDKIQEVSGVRPTINDIIAYCLTLVAGRLRDGSVAKELRHKLVRKDEALIRSREKLHLQSLPLYKDAPKDERVSLPCFSNASSYAAVDHMVEGTPINQSALDMSTPTALFKRYSRKKSPSRRSETQARKNLNVKWKQFIKGLIRSVDVFFHPYCTGFKDYLQILIPVAARTTLPTGLDNFTGPVLVRLPLYQYTRQRIKSNLKMKCGNDTELQVVKTLVAPLKHLQNVKAEIDLIKHRNVGPVFFLLTCLAAKVFPDSIVRKVVTAMNNRIQLVMTNVKGSEGLSTIGGKRVHSMQFWPPAKGEFTGGISILSYRDKIHLFSIFDEAEFAQIFSHKELKKLTRNDRAALAQFVSNLIKNEFLNLHDLLTTIGASYREENLLSQ